MDSSKTNTNTEMGSSKNNTNTDHHDGIEISTVDHEGIAPDHHDDGIPDHHDDGIPDHHDSGGSNRNASAVLNIVFFFLIFIPLGILGSALEWPQNLEEDASHNLPLLLDEQSSTFWGYFIYLVYSILFYPMAAMMASTVAAAGNSSSVSSSNNNAPGPSPSILIIGNGFAALSSVCRSIGLSRWLFAMPTLARIYVDPNTPEMTKEMISVCYEMLNGWGGGIGEILGVSLFASLWVACTSVLYIQSPIWPSWMGWLGFLVSIDLALNLLEMSILDYDMGINLALAVILLHLWILAGAILFLLVRPSCCSKTPTVTLGYRNG